MACNPVFLLPHTFKPKKSIAVEFTCLIVAVFNRISMEYTSRISLLSATQFTMKKSDFERFAMTDKDCF